MLLPNIKPRGSLKSFTLTEVIITLAISAVLISLVVKLFTYFSEAKRINNKRLTDYEEIISCDRLLSELMYKSDSVHYFNDELLFFFENAPAKSLSICDSIIVYTNSDYCDTFHLNITEIKYDFDLSVPSLVKSIRFNVTYSDQILPVNIIKEYEGDVIVKSQLDKNED